MLHLQNALTLAGLDWLFITLALLMPLWLPVLVMLVLPRLLRWDDARRHKIKDRPGFSVQQPLDEESGDRQ